MSRKAFILDLAKLCITAAWADGKLDHEEVNALKELLFNLDEVSGEDWGILEMYMDQPVTRPEAEELQQRVLAGIRGGADKALAVSMLEKLFMADGVVSPEEQAFLDRFKGELKDRSLFSQLGGALKSALGQRNHAANASRLREHHAEDYEKNTVYYDLLLKQQERGVKIAQPEDKVRKVCLAAGLLAHVALADEDLSPDERRAMRDILSKDWEIAEDHAELLVEISGERSAKGLDYFRLSHTFFSCSRPEERAQLIATAFKIANAAGKTSNEEIETIRKIAKSLKLSHQDFIDAKLTISSEDRKGL